MIETEGYKRACLQAEKEIETAAQALAGKMTEEAAQELKEEEVTRPGPKMERVVE